MDAESSSNWEILRIEISSSEDIEAVDGMVV